MRFGDIEIISEVICENPEEYIVSSIGKNSSGREYKIEWHLNEWGKINKNSLNTSKESISAAFDWGNPIIKEISICR